MTVASSMPSPNRWNPSASERSVAAWKNLRKWQTICVTVGATEIKMLCTQTQHNSYAHCVTNWFNPMADAECTGSSIWYNKSIFTFFPGLESHSFGQNKFSAIFTIIIINFSCCFGRPCRLEISTQSDYWDNANAIHSMSKQRKKSIEKIAEYSVPFTGRCLCCTKTDDANRALKQTHEF